MVCVILVLMQQFIFLHWSALSVDICMGHKDITCDRCHFQCILFWFSYFTFIKLLFLFWWRHFVYMRRRQHGDSFRFSWCCSCQFSLCHISMNSFFQFYIVAWSQFFSCPCDLSRLTLLLMILNGACCYTMWTKVLGPYTLRQQQLLDHGNCGNPVWCWCQRKFGTLQF